LKVRAFSVIGLTATVGVTLYVTQIARNFPNPKESSSQLPKRSELFAHLHPCFQPQAVA